MSFFTVLLAALGTSNPIVWPSGPLTINAVLLNASRLRMHPDGTSDTEPSGSPDDDADWLNFPGGTPGSGFQCRWVQVSGDVPDVTPGAENTWLTMASIRELGYNQADEEGVFNVSLRETGNPANAVTRQVHFVGL